MDRPTHLSSPKSPSFRLSTALLVPFLAAMACESDGNPSPIPKPTDPAVAARAAAFLGSCMGTLPTNEWLQLMYEPWRFPAPMWNNVVTCLAAKTNGCQAATDCLGLTAGDVCGATPEGCDGNTAVRCDEVLFRQDCGKLGMACWEGGGPDEVGCVEAVPEACDENDFVSVCESGRPLGCDGFVRVGPRCADYGLACDIELATDEAMCQGTATGSCEVAELGPLDPKGLGCSGTRLEACVNNKIQAFDCGLFGTGLNCQTLPDAEPAFFCGLAAECDPGKAATCEGATTMVLCNAGRVERVSCTTLGFTRCDAVEGVCTPGPFDL